MMEPEKEILEQTKGVAVEVYKDALSPVVKPIGEILGFLPRTLKLTLSGWEKWLINGEESLRSTAEAIKEKVKKIPEDHLVEPEPYVAIPAIQQISYCQNSEELRDLYANFLTASMTVDKKWQVHPSFVDIIKQLTPDEAKYLKALHLSTAFGYPLIDVKFEKKDHISVVTNFTDYNINVLEHPGSICSYIENLNRLSLITVSNLETSKLSKEVKQWYEKIKTHLVHLTDHEEDESYLQSYKQFSLTNFGLNFIKVVCR